MVCAGGTPQVVARFRAMPLCLLFCSLLLAGFSTGCDQLWDDRFESSPASASAEYSPDLRLTVSDR